MNNTNTNTETIALSVACPFCSAITSLEVPRDGFNRYNQGELVQKAFPTLSADDRELLMTGMCLPCQKKTFGY